MSEGNTNKETPKAYTATLRKMADRETDTFDAPKPTNPEPQARSHRPRHRVLTPVDLSLLYNPKDIQKRASDHYTEKYDRPLTPAELEAKKWKLAETQLDLEALEAEKKEVMSRYTAQLKAIKNTLNRTASEIITETEETEGKLYKVVHHAAGKVEIYDSAGEIITQRDIYPAEKQTRIAFEPPTDSSTESEAKPETPTESST